MTAQGWLARAASHPAVQIAVILIVAVATRLYHVDAPGTLVDRDYTSAIFARDFYLARADVADPAIKEMAHYVRMRQPVLEPPVTEWLVSWLYTAAGHESFRLARAVTSAFWFAGGWFMFMLARRVSSTQAAVIALAIYLLLPLSVELSRSFQADALMMLLFLASLYLVVRFHESNDRNWLLLASACSAAALIYRPLVLFALVGAFLVPRWSQRGWRSLVERETWIYGLVATAPMVAYYGYATFVARFFGWKLTSSFRFDLWAHREYWLGWLDLAFYAVGLLGVVTAAIGVPWLRRGLPRSIVAGLALGYVVFGLLFTMHVHTHGYYHAQLIPIVALASAPLAAALVERVLQDSDSPLWWVPAAVVGLVLATVGARELGARIRLAKFESERAAAEIGRIVGHSRRVVWVSRYYGIPLQYNALIAGSFWPRPVTYWLYRTAGERELSIRERIDGLGFVPEFFVITFFSEYETHHADLARYLAERCTLKSESSEYLVYERCAPPGS